MLEDKRPKVTMTKNELTKLLGLEVLVKKNSKSKAYDTILDVVSNYLCVTRATLGGVDLQEKP
jgi:hypothetical protein